MLAEWTGLEPATPGVTGRYSNQLNYHSFFASFATIQTRSAQPIDQLLAATYQPTEPESGAPEGLFNTLPALLHNRLLNRGRSIQRKIIRCEIFSCDAAKTA
jgi:hypothetical protein